MKLKQQLIRREIAGKNVLIPVGEMAQNHAGLFVLNELGAFIWDVLPQAEDEDAVLQAVLAEYEVSAEEAKRDIHEFLAKLRQMDIL